MLRLFFIISSVCLVSLDAHAGDPFMGMVGKTYAEYHDAWFHAVAPVDGDSLAARTVGHQLAEAAAKSNSREWKLMSRMIDANIRYSEERRWGYMADTKASERFIAEMNEVQRLASHYKLPHIRFWAMYYTAVAYRRFICNYYLAFESYLRLAAELEHISTHDFPPRSWMLNDMASLYVEFRDYDKAIDIYNKVMADTAAADVLYYPLPSACNGLGMCYREIGNLDKSDKYFNEILKQNRVAGMWEGIVEGNLGENHYLRGDSEGAIPLLSASIEHIKRVNDFAFVTGRAVTLAEIYLARGNLREARRYIDTALYKHRRTLLPEKPAALYTVLSEYNIRCGNTGSGIAYLDSAMTAKERDGEAFNGIVLQRIEQERHTEQMRLTAARLRAYLWLAAIVAAALIMAVVFGLFYRRLYRKKRAAYSELVHKAEQWAAETNLKTVGENASADDRQLLKRINNVMLGDKLFADSALTIDMLATRLGEPRYAVSKAINAVTGKNFNAFVNEYRIQEAVRLLSTTTRYSSNIEALYAKVGFASRTTFYNAFKKVTGLSPKEFTRV